MLGGRDSKQAAPTPPEATLSGFAERIMMMLGLLQRPYRRNHVIPRKSQLAHHPRWARDG